ncbi:MAG: DUF4097 domain-containing protein [Defluviitaleaceae bacterium]|nr:DUF4097 domain-containing protein [Defluviitaleaceae bacterium]
MDDRKYNNDGTLVGGGIPHEVPATPPPRTGTPRKRRFPWNRLALILIIFGGLLFSAGWLSGSRGGHIYFRGGSPLNFWGFEIRSVNRDSNEATTLNLPDNAESIRGIIINTTAMNIVLRPLEDGNKHLVTYGDVEPEINFTNGILSIDTRRRERELGRGFSGFNLGVYNYEVVLYVPNGTPYGAIELSSISGNIRTDGFNADTLTVRSTSGNIRILDSDIAVGNLQSTSGNVYVTNGSILNLTAEGASGNITVDTALLAGGNAELRTASGNIRFTGNSPQNVLFDYNLRTATGMVRINGNRADNSQVTAANPHYTINARAASGNIHLNLPALTNNFP